MSAWRTFLMAMIAIALCGCAALQGEPDSASAGQPGEQNLIAGIRYYEDGKYNEARKALQMSLSRGLSDRDQVRAHKYLAFIHCVSEDEAKCRSHFRMALAINPGFSLAPAESGHPIWGPAFRSVKDPR